ncbi:hypothetical protein [Lacisediminihabitans changchengi]|uniref:Uncharacterized protein n=1 Tax=Lacisediminihabitans changchengi TaxID=2787634 RepID=A0A934W4A8_9MICO|nr:hypothetical protein [Lacisediminihabitans changchengi]MBK4347310.1 hypothetical protein [Lacisediminihabitans changchengi]
MAMRAPLPPTHPVDQLIGFTGFFVVVFFGVTVYCELSAQPALGWALLLLGLVVLFGLLIRRRMKIVRLALEAAVEEDESVGTGSSVQ